MAGIVPIPTTRISGLLARQRLLAQLQGDQLELFRLQNQVSTGRRITLPSEDAPAAQRAISLQRLLERKEQFRTTVDSGNLFLANTDTALKDVASTLGTIRGAALGVAGTTSSQSERDAIASQVGEALDLLLGVANRRYLGRYLFAGSQTNVEPYAFDGAVVHYAGDHRSIDNFSDIGVLFSTNAPGLDVFGGISDDVVGDADLDPHLSEDTLLSSLRRGHGVSPNGSLQISDGTNSVIVDISRAVTLGDVARMIEASPPAGRTLSVTITGSELRLQLDAAGGGNLTVTEVGSGSTASELGILETTGVLTNPLVGGDLEPVILKTTKAADLLGAKARARLVSAGDNNDLLIEAVANGAAFNGVDVQVVADVSPGGETAVYNAGAGTLTIHVAATGSTANAVAAAINAQGTFHAELDPLDSINLAQAGTGLTSTAAVATTAHGNGTTLDLASGIRVVNGNDVHTITFAGAETVEDILNALNAAEYGLAAEINADGTGINIRSRLSGADFQIGENGGQTASQLGLRTLTAQTRLDELNYGVGVPAKTGDDYTINLETLSLTTRSGQEFEIDLSLAATVGDVIDAINTATGASVTAQGAAGGGITLVDNTVGTGEMGVGQSGDPLAIAGGVAAHVPPVDFSITARDGTVYNVSLAGAETIDDAINLINTATLGEVFASLAPIGNGIRLSDVSGGAGALTVTSHQGGQAAELLGLVPEDATTATSATGVIDGADRHFLETTSVFTTLIRLRDALKAGDLPEISRAVSAIDADIDRAAAAQAEVGARERALEITQHTLEDEDVLLRSALADEIEVDVVEAISNLTARQISLEASLRSMANILQLSLLNFI